MKKIFITLIFLISLSSVFAANALDMVSQTAEIQVPPYEYCIDQNGVAEEKCFEYARPMVIEDCDLIKPEFENYEKLLLNCYVFISYRDPTACEVMPFNDANKQLCFIRAKACEKINSIDERDSCYKNKLECDKISSGEKKEICVNSVNQKTSTNLINQFLFFLAIAILIISPIIVVIIVVKTIIDFFKHISIISWIIRIGLIIFFIVLWLVVGFIFLMSQVMMKGY